MASSRRSQRDGKVEALYRDPATGRQRSARRDEHGQPFPTRARRQAVGGRHRDGEEPRPRPPHRRRVPRRVARGCQRDAQAVHARSVPHARGRLRARAHRRADYNVSTTLGVEPALRRSATLRRPWRSSARGGDGREGASALAPGTQGR